MSKENMGLKIIGNPFVFSELFAIVRCDRVGSVRPWLQQLDNCICYIVGSLALDFPEQGQARLPFRQGDDGLSVTFPNDRVHFPISKAQPGIHNGWPLVDAHPVLELATPIVAAVALPALLLASQMAMKISTGLFILENVLIDPLVADWNAEMLSKPARDLLGAPLLAYQPFNPLPGSVCDAIVSFLASVQSKLVSLFGSIAFQSTVPSQFSADGGFVNLDNPCNLRLVVPGFSKGINLVSLFLSKLRVGIHLCSFDFGRSKKHESYRSLLLVPTFKVALVS